MMSSRLSWAVTSEPQNKDRLQRAHFRCVSVIHAFNNNPSFRPRKETNREAVLGNYKRRRQIKLSVQLLPDNTDTHWLMFAPQQRGTIQATSLNYSRSKVQLYQAHAVAHSSTARGAFPKLNHQSQFVETQTPWAAKRCPWASHLHMQSGSAENIIEKNTIISEFDSRVRAHIGWSFVWKCIYPLIHLLVFQHLPGCGRSGSRQNKAALTSEYLHKEASKTGITVPQRYM